MSLLQARRLTRRFGGLTAVDNVSLDLALDEIHAVLGNVLSALRLIPGGHMIT